VLYLIVQSSSFRTPSAGRKRSICGQGRLFCPPLAPSERPLPETHRVLGFQPSENDRRATRAVGSEIDALHGFNGMSAVHQNHGADAVQQRGKNLRPPGPVSASGSTER
jgi:hypothetical protein